MTGVEVLVIVAFTAAGACVQGSVGIGLVLVCGPALVTIDPAFAPGPFLLGGLLIGARHIVVERQHIDYRTVRHALIGVPFGVAGALALLAAITDSAMALVVGAATVLAAAALLAGARVAPSRRAEAVGGGAIAFSSVAAGLPGPPAAVVFSHLTPPAMRGTTSAITACIAIVGGIGLIAANEYGSHEAELTGLMLPGVALGLAASRFTRPYLDRTWFRPAVLVVALVGGLMLVIRELM